MNSQQSQRRVSTSVDGPEMSQCEVELLPIPSNTSEGTVVLDEPQASSNVSLPEESSKEAVVTAEVDREPSNSAVLEHDTVSSVQSEQECTPTEQERRFHNYVTPSNLDDIVDRFERRVSFNVPAPVHEAPRYVGKGRSERKSEQKKIRAFIAIFSLLTLSLVVVYIIASHSQAKITELERRVNALQTSGLGEETNVTQARVGQLESNMDDLSTTTDTSLTILRSLLSLMNSLTDSSVEPQLNSLQLSVENLTSIQNNTLAELSSLLTLVDALNTAQTATTAQLTSLQASVSALSTAQTATDTQVTALQSSVSTLTTDQASTATQVSSLQSSVDTLTTRINSPVNLYQNCIQETESCTINVGGATNHQADVCVTPWKSLNSAGYHTSEIRCMYDPNYLFFETNLLEYDATGLARCTCGVTRIHYSTILNIVHDLIPSDYAATCHMVVTRCPNTINLP